MSPINPQRDSVGAETDNGEDLLLLNEQMVALGDISLALAKIDEGGEPPSPTDGKSLGESLEDTLRRLETSLLPSVSDLPAAESQHPLTQAPGDGALDRLIAMTSASTALVPIDDHGLTAILSAKGFTLAPVKMREIIRISTDQDVPQPIVESIVKISENPNSALLAVRAAGRLGIGPFQALQIAEESQERNVGTKLISDEVLLVYYTHLNPDVPWRWQLANDIREDFKKLSPEEKLNYFEIRDQLSEMWLTFTKSRDSQTLSFHDVVRLFVYTKDSAFVDHVLNAIDQTPTISSSERESDRSKFFAVLRQVRSSYLAEDGGDFDVEEFLTEHAAIHDSRLGEDGKRPYRDPTRIHPDIEEFLRKHRTLDTDDDEE